MPRFFSKRSIFAGVLSEEALAEKHTKGEMHGCIVCGKLYELYVVYDATGKFVDCTVMSAGGRRVPNVDRPLVACDRHGSREIEADVVSAYGPQKDDDDE